MRILSYENEFCMQFHFHANQSYFHKNGFALRLVLKQRHKGTRKWPIEATCEHLSAILDTHGRVVLMTSPFSDSIVFTVHTRKQRFQKVSFSNRSTLESVFEWLRFR